MVAGSDLLQSAYRHHQAGRYADAARKYQALLEQNPDDVAVLHLFGVLHQQSGYHLQAVELIGRAIALRPDVAAYYSNLGEAYRSLKKYDQAVDCCRTALRLQPDYPEAANNLGLALHDLGRDAEAVEQFDDALRRRPDFAFASNNRGTSLLRLRRTNEAEESFRDAVRLDPNLAIARSNLGQLLTDRAMAAEGLAHCLEAVRLQPNLPGAHNNLGNALLALRRLSEARAAFEAAIRLDPTLATAFANLGLTWQYEGKIRFALPYFHRAVELAPNDANLITHLVLAYADDEDWGQAVNWSERRVLLEPESALAHSDLGWACQSFYRTQQAYSAYHRALKLQPDHLDAWLNLGSLQEEQGNLTEAEECYRQAEQMHPTSPLPLARRAKLMKARFSDIDRDRLRFFLDGPLTPVSRMTCLYALASVADSRGDAAEAAACLLPANELARKERLGKGHFYDPDEQTHYVDRLIECFTPELFARLSDCGDPSDQPVFVFGMPRSGTTLVEQILSSHSRIHGAGELLLGRRAMDSFPRVTSRLDHLEQALQGLDAAQLQTLGQSYRNGLQSVISAQTVNSNPNRVVDKFPENYLYLGLLALMFPNATLIHVRRDLRDVAISCWQNHFRSIRWADDPDNLVRRCHDYRRLMEHWHAVLPRTIHVIQYELLVDNFEPEARRIIEACSLDWEPACLQFHETTRTVRTASVTQVRQPIYRKSVERWKAYEPYLGFLLDRISQPARHR